MSKQSSLLIYVVDLLTRNCESVWLPLVVNEIIYWRYVLQGYIRTFQSIDGNLYTSALVGGGG